MIERTNKMKLLLYGVTLITALVILIDFALPGKVFIGEVLNVEKQKQRYYNAGGNSHNSYKVATATHHFSVSKDFAKSAQNKQIKYSESLIFKEINRHRLLSSEKSTIYSFRVASGLALPLLVMLTIFIAYRFKKRISTLLFVLQIALLANLILLIL